MTARRVHAVIAAGLENPALLARWRQEPHLLLDCGVEPDKLDLDALWKFAGLSAKVRHNGLRADFPLTFRLLNVAGLEIEVFASYASFRANRGAPRYGETAEARAQDLLSFLEQWLDFERLEHVLLWDLMRDELARMRLSKPRPPEDDSPAAQFLVQRAPRAASIPLICGEAVLHEMRCDPRAVAATLREKSPCLEEVTMGMFHFCYWRRGAEAEINILQLDELGFYLLSLVDGKRTAAELSRALGGGKRPAREFLNVLGELASLGILEFVE